MLERADASGEQASKVIDPEFSFRFSIDEISDSYESLDAAFEDGAYLLVAEKADPGSELEGCGLVLGGALGRGLRILQAQRSLTARGKVCKAFAEWSLGQEATAQATLMTVNAGGPYLEKGRALLKLIEKDKITVFATAAFLPVPTIAAATDKYRRPVQEFGRFTIKYVGTQLSENAYGYEPEQPFDAFLNALPPEERPDFLFALTPQWLPPKNFEKVDLPKVIWCHDGDMFVYRAIDNFLLYDVRICLTSQEQYEMSRAVGQLCISNLMSDPLNTEFPKTRLSTQKDFDLIFTGSVFDVFHAEKARFIYQIAELADDFKVSLIDGYLPRDEYYDLLARSKFLPVVSRNAGNPTPRWRDALANSAYVLYPQGTTYGKAFPGCFPVNASSIAQDIRVHLTAYDAGDAAYDLPRTAADIAEEMRIFQEGRDKLFERLLKLAAFSAFVLRPVPQEKRPQKRRLVWPTPCVDPSIYQRDVIEKRLSKIAEAEAEDALIDERDFSNLARLHAALALIFSESPRAEQWRARADQLFAKGCRRFPASLLLHFNRAHWRFFRNSDWRTFGDRNAPAVVADAAAGARMFWLLVDSWDTFEFNPIGADVAFPYTLLEADRVFPYYEYGQLAICHAAEVGVGGVHRRFPAAALRDALKGAAYGYLGWEAIERNSTEEGFEYVDKSLRAFPDNLALLRFLLESQLHVAQKDEALTASLAHRICDTFLLCANKYPAILLTHTHRLGQAFRRAQRTGDLRHVLEGWYRLGKITYSTKPAERFDREIDRFIDIFDLEEFMPQRLRSKLDLHLQGAGVPEELSQFEDLVLSGALIREAMLAAGTDRSAQYQLVPRDFLIDAELPFTGILVKDEARLDELHRSRRARVAMMLNTAIEKFSGRLLKR